MTTPVYSFQLSADGRKPQLALQNQYSSLLQSQAYQENNIQMSDDSTAVNSQPPSAQTFLNFDKMAAASVEPQAPIAAPQDDEMLYVTDEAGVIVSLDSINWNPFIQKNSDFPLPEHIRRCQFPSIIGRNLFEFIGDVKVQGFFRHIIYMLITGMQSRFVYHWFCDSPEFERKMSMVVTKLSTSSHQHLILWRSKIIKETILKPQQTYLAAPAVQVAPPDQIATKPVRSVCSYCKRILVSWNEVQSPEKVLNLITQLDGPCYDEDYAKDGVQIPIIGARGKAGQQYSSTGKVTHLWLTAKQYYGTFLDDDITINHSICEICSIDLNLLILPPGSYHEGQRVV